MKSTKKSIESYLLIFVLLSLTCSLLVEKNADRETPAPPHAERIYHADTTHGDIRVDYYNWLKDRNNPRVIEYLKAENEYSEIILKYEKETVDSLFDEMRSRITLVDTTVPVRIDSFLYYDRLEEKSEYRIHCRKKLDAARHEEIILDENNLASGKEYFDLGAYRVSPDHRYVAYSIDTTGSERYTLFIKDLKKDRILPERISDTDYPVIWGPGNNNIFYCKQDDMNRPYRVFKHRLNTSTYNDTEIYREPDDAYFIYLSKTKDGKYLLINLESKITTEIRFIPAESLNVKPRIFRPRERGIEYSLEHHASDFIILTNENAKNFKIMTVPDNNSNREWETLIEHNDTVMLNGIDVFKNHLAIYERTGGLEQVRILDFNTGRTEYLEFPEPTYSIWSTENHVYDTEKVRYIYTSLKTPESVYEYNMNTNTVNLLKRERIPGGFNPDNFISERIFTEASDGTKIPISLVYRRGIIKNGSNPLLLTGYGAYGLSSSPYFSRTRLCLLTRDFIYAIAHVRGGGEYGKYWYEDGKFLNKKNTFTDFISCAEELINRGYTNNKNLAISGVSAGGLLIGTVVNMRPELFSAVIADVPFVDVLNTMLDPSIPLTVLEYDEWGNPNQEKFYNYMKSYSPYDNVRNQDYPDMLITAGLNDRRVGYWEPAKWTAKLRYMKTDDNLLLLKTNMGAGHGGISGRFSYLKEIAREYTFLLKVLGVKL